MDISREVVKYLLWFYAKQSFLRVHVFKLNIRVM